MKTTRYLLCIFLFVLSCVVQLSAQQLEIHQLNVGSGDAAIILSRKQDNSINKIMIIDFGDVFSSDLVGSYLNYILDYRGDIDYAIISHYDKDHYGGYAKFTENYLDTFKTKIKHLIIPGGLGSSLQYPKKGLTPGKSDWNPALPAIVNNSELNELQTFLSNITNGKHVSLISQLSEIKKIDADFTFDTYNSIPIRMELVAGLQYVKGKDERILNKKTYNDDCLAWVLHFGQFRFYTGGDLGGNGKGYVDHETPLADYLASHDDYNAKSLNKINSGTLTKGHVCVAKINHHGSEESSNTKFLETTNPSAWLISCGIRFDHPHISVIERMAKTGISPIDEDGIRGVFVTCPKEFIANNIAKQFKNTSKFFLQYGTAKINGNSSTLPWGTYIVIVKPVNTCVIEDEDEDTQMKENIPITKRSVFTVRYLGKQYYHDRTFICHEN